MSFIKLRHAGLGRFGFIQGCTATDVPVILGVSIRMLASVRLPKRRKLGLKFETLVHVVRFAAYGETFALEFARPGVPLLQRPLETPETWISPGRSSRLAVG